MKAEYFCDREAEQDLLSLKNGRNILSFEGLEEGLLRTLIKEEENDAYVY